MSATAEITRPRAEEHAGEAAEAAARAGEAGAAGAADAVPAATGRRVAFEQALVAGGQLAAGLGNLAFALVAARVLEPRGFAQLAAFLALYLLVHVPASSLSAGSALAPGLAQRQRRRAVLVGGGIGAAVALAAVPLSGPAGVPPALLFVLAAAVPAAGWLALERGRLYGAAEHGRAAASLAIEPVVRLALGIPLLLAAGAVGGAIAVVLGGVAALAVTKPRTRLAPEQRSGARPRAAAETEQRSGGAGGVEVRAGGGAAGAGALLATLAFLALAIVQNQDVVLANGLLDAAEAGKFAVLSTLGGAAAFATTTVPLVLLPRAARGERHALAVAVGLAALLGAGAVGAVALVPDRFITGAFGDEYAGVTDLVVPYVAAMALFGVARVLVAHRAATGAGAGLVAAVAVVALAQAAGIVAGADDARGVMLTTLAATAALAVVAAVPQPRTLNLRGAVLAVAGLTLAALAVRLVITRGIWLDEATSITQAQLPLGELLESLRTSDVHPPLHHLILWAIAHGTGSVSELAMRAPSILAGTALVPTLYLLGRELYDRRAATLAAAFAAFAPFLVWYSQEARMYALFMLFAALAMLGQLRALRRGRKRDWALWAGATVGLLWTQYFGVFFTAVQVAGFAIAAFGLHRAGRLDRRFLLPWVAATLLVIAAFAPLIPFALDQFQANQAAGRGFNAPKQAGGVDATREQPGVYLALTNLVWAVWGYHANSVMAAITSLWPIGILGALLALGRRGRPLTMYVVACALVPALMLAALGVLKPFLFEIRYFAGAVPLLLVLFARAATGWTRGRTATLAVMAVLVGALGVAAVDQQVNGSNPRVYDFEGALDEVADHKRPGDVVAFEPSYLRDVVRYYDPGVKTTPVADGIPVDRPRVYLLASFQDQPRHRQAIVEAADELRRTHRLVRVEKRPQIRVYVFERKEAPR